jgi:hypothetical protein
MSPNKRSPETPVAQKPKIHADTEVDLALKRYDIVMKYLATENTLYWTRSQILLLANTALLGYAANQLNALDADLSKEPWTRLSVVLVECLFGLLLCVAWHFGIDAGAYWMDRWQDLLTDRLEPVAFPDNDVFRNVKRPKPRSRTIALLLMAILALV